MITKLLFDLDGTLTEPKEGICKSVQYALHELGIEEPDIDKLEPFIGPPLMDSFMEFYGMTKERAAEAVVKYRERFAAKGWSENIVYEGIPHLLKSLRDEGYTLAVASSKPTVFVERILTHFGLREAFSVVVGSELDGRRINKDEVIAEALRQLYAGQDAAAQDAVEQDAAGQDAVQQGAAGQDAAAQDAAEQDAAGQDAAAQDAVEQGAAAQDAVEQETAGQDAAAQDAAEHGGKQGSGLDAAGEMIRYDEILMIGDRRFDVEGAHALGIPCVGVTYGYAQPGELKDAQADFLADSPDELLKLLLGLREKDNAGLCDTGKKDSTGLRDTGKKDNAVLCDTGKKEGAGLRDTGKKDNAGLCDTGKKEGAGLGDTGKKDNAGLCDIDKKDSAGLRDIDEKDSAASAKGGNQHA